MPTCKAVVRVWQVRSFFVLALGLAVLAGCGPTADTPPTAPVEGTVTYQGQPVESGVVTFYPEEGERPASGMLGPGGTFTLTTFEQGDGAVPGTHKVTVASGDAGENVGMAPAENSIPAKYSDAATTPLTLEVEQGSNEFEIELED